MFVRTQRLTLRPGWIEDAPALSRAIAHPEVVTRLARAPWPYALGDARAFLAAERPVDEPGFLIFAHEAGTVRLIGGMGVARDEEGEHAFGYWLTPEAWGRGYATEAGRGVIATLRDTLRLRRLKARHFIDNPASGRVLRKLGFRSTGRTVPCHARARGVEVPCALYTLDLAAGDEGGGDAPQRMAA